MPRGRKLRPEELALWHEAMRRTRPLHPPERPERPAITGEDDPASERPPRADGRSAGQRIDTPAPPLVPFRLGARTTKAATASRPPGTPALRMDATTHARMLRGKLAPEARIDLHGMTLAEARPELIRFLLAAHADGRRLVLVITGKGRRITEPVPRPVGALRHQVPHWLRLAPLETIVLQVAEAHIRHGGAGALYVFLRRARG